MCVQGWLRLSNHLPLRVVVSLLSDRRIIAPYGLAGGRAAKRGQNEIIVRGRRKKLPSKCSFDVPSGGVIRVETPGGGGWGS